MLDDTTSSATSFLVKRMKEALAALHTSPKEPPTDADLDRIVAAAGVERTCAAIKRKLEGDELRGGIVTQHTVGRCAQPRKGTAHRTDESNRNADVSR